MVCPPPPCPPTPVTPVPPPPPPPPPAGAVAKGFSLPWWAFLAALPPIVDVDQHQQQKMKQKQQQKQKQKQRNDCKPPRPPKPPCPPTPPDVCIPKTPDAIPEPGTMVLMGLGLAGASLLAHRRRRARC